MFLTIVLLLAWAIVAAIGIPLMLKLVPPNPYYGYPAQRKASKPEHWTNVNMFAGRALVVAAGFSAVILMTYNGTWLRGGFAQFLAFLIPLAGAIGATVWYDRKHG